MKVGSKKKRSYNSRLFWREVPKIMKQVKIMGGKETKSLLTAAHRSVGLESPTLLDLIHGFSKLKAQVPSTRG